MNSPLPFTSESDPFTQELDGVFGIFKTDQSFELNYLLGAIPISSIERLMTASEEFDILQSSFSDLVQRDIDYGRVQDIVDDYLLNGTDRVIFFPPLLVSLVVFEGGVMTDTYKDVSCVDDSGWMVKTWDKTRFQIKFPLLPADNESNHFVFDSQGRPRPIYHYGCKLRYNPDHTRLIVIDGQHRLCALKHLQRNSERRYVLENIQIPVCVVFSPNATVENSDGEKIKRHLRDLFVTINSKGKAVSGHFLTLLDDKSLAALAVRQVAQAWKECSDDGYSKLHFLEWNQRDKNKADQITEKCSKTTVSILSDAFTDYIFDKRKAGLTKSMLNLEEVSTELERVPGATSTDSISDENFDPSQSDLLAAQIDKYLVPSITCLFGAPSVYKALEDKFSTALGWLDMEVDGGKKGAASFRDEVLRKFRSVSPLDPPATREKSREFNEHIAGEEEGGHFFLNVFQKGYIQAWVTVSKQCLKHSLSPPQSAQAFVSAMEKLSFRAEKSLFASNKTYMQLTLYRGETVVVTKNAKDLWSNLLLSSLWNQGVVDEFIAVARDVGEPVDAGELKEALSELGKKSFIIFLSELEEKIQTDFEKNWTDRDVDAQVREALQNLQNDPEKIIEYKEYIEKHLTKSKLAKGTTALRNVLEIS